LQVCVGIPFFLFMRPLVGINSTAGSFVRALRDGSDRGPAVSLGLEFPDLDDEGWLDVSAPVLCFVGPKAGTS
jgi:hypothetical protein